MTARYIRVSSQKQNIARQTKCGEDEIVYTDYVSGAIPFSERLKAKELLAEVFAGNVDLIVVNSIDRLGRSTLDVLSTINLLHKNGATLFVENLGLKSLSDGQENPTFKLIVAVLANIAEMERTALRERQLQGIAIAKSNGTYKGRQKGTNESSQEFLSKYPVVVSYLKKQNHYTLKEIAKLGNCNINTVQKVKKILKENDTVFC